MDIEVVPIDDYVAEFTRYGYRTKVVLYGDLPKGALMDGRFKVAIWRDDMDEPVSWASDESIQIPCRKARDWVRKNGY